MKSLLVLLITLLPLLIAQAEGQIPFNQKPWWYLGGELGLQNKTSVQTPEVENSGSQIGLKGGYTKYSENWIWDVGLGYRYDKMDENNVEVETKAFLGEAGLRYRFNDHWSLGPQLQLLMGEDVSFSDIGTNSDDKSSSLFIGGRVFYDIWRENKQHIWRMGLQFASDFNIDDRSISYVQFVVEHLWPIKSVRPRRKALPDEEPGIKLNLKEAGVRFATGSAELVGQSKLIIESLAKVLKKYEGEWNFIKVSGHTDVTGEYRSNIQLSLARAEAVRIVFVEYGISEQKISSQGFGPDRPIDDSDTPEAYAKNRRVELNVVSEYASPEFANALNKSIERAKK